MLQHVNHADQIERPREIPRIPPMKRYDFGNFAEFAEPLIGALGAVKFPFGEFFSEYAEKRSDSAADLEKISTARELGRLRQRLHDFFRANAFRAGGIEYRLFRPPALIVNRVLFVDARGIFPPRGIDRFLNEPAAAADEQAGEIAPRFAVRGDERKISESGDLAQTTLGTKKASFIFFPRHNVHAARVTTRSSG